MPTSYQEIINKYKKPEMTSPLMPLKLADALAEKKKAQPITSYQEIINKYSKKEPIKEIKKDEQVNDIQSLMPLIDLATGGTSFSTPAVSNVNTLNIPKDILQGIARSGGSIGLTLTGQDELKIDSQSPKTQQVIQNIIFGEEPVKSLQTRIAESELAVKDFAKQYNIPMVAKSALPLSIVGVGLSVALDFTGSGGEKNVFRAIAKSKDIGEISNILRKINVAEDIIPSVAGKFVNITDEKAVKTALDKIAELQKTTKFVGKSEVVAKPLQPLAQEAIPKGLQPLLKLVNDNKNVYDFKMAVKDPNALPEIKSAKEALLNNAIKITKGKPMGDFAPTNLGRYLKENNIKSFDDFYAQATKGAGVKSLTTVELEALGYKQAGPTIDLTVKEKYFTLPQATKGAEVKPFLTTDIQGNQVEQQFIRAGTKLEQKGGVAKSRGYNTIPDKKGYEKVYKPYSEQGSGYYYSKVIPTETALPITEVKITPKTETIKVPKVEIKPNVGIREALSTDTPINREIIKAEQELPIGELHPKKAGVYQGFKNKTAELWQGVRQFVEDDWIRVKNLARREDVKITGELTPSERRALMYGRIETRLEEGRSIAKNIDKDIIDTSRKVGRIDKELNDLVDQYLIAKHAPERNALLGKRAAGISTEEAKKVLSDIEKLDIGKEVKRIADKVSGFNNKVLDILYAGGRSEGVISRETYDILRSKYKNHIPLNRIMDETEDVGGVLLGKGLDVKGSGLIKAKGSERNVADIMTNVKSNYDQAIQRIEKNIVDQETLRMVRDNPQLNMFEIVKPQAIGRTFSGEIILQKITDPSILTMREFGKPVYIKIKDPQLALALKGINREKMGPFMRTWAMVTRFMSSLATRFNPEFAIPNKIRDLQEAATYLLSQKEFGFKGASKIATRDLKSQKSIVEWMLGKETEGAKLYQQMKMDGGTTGGLSLSTRNQVVRDMDKIRELNRSNPKKAAETFLRGVEKWNTLFEDSTRLSVYKESLERGLSRDRAAVLAKQATIDFNKMGTGGPVINAIWMFSNASIQGSAKMLKAMKNPKVLVSVSGVVGTGVWATGTWNDRIDPDWRNKVSKWDRLNGLPIVLPGDGNFNYITIPVSWGLKPIKVAMDYGYDLATGKNKDLQDSIGSILAAFIEGYNPVGGTDIISAITPSVLDLPSDIRANKSWTGSKIKPDWDKYAPNSTQYFSDLKKTTIGKVFIGITKDISDATGGRIEISPADVDYAYNQIVGGAGRFSSKIINSISAIGKGELPPAKEVPFTSRFYRSVEQERIGAESGETKKLKQILSEQSRQKFYENQEAETLHEEMKKLPKEQATSAWNELYKRDQNIAKKVYAIANEEKLGLTYEDRMVKQLGVENGERAKYLFEQFKNIKTKEEKTRLWNELVNKKIITQTVLEQTNWLIKNK